MTAQGGGGASHAVGARRPEVMKLEPERSMKKERHRKPKRRGETERKMGRMGHDASQPATSAVRGTRPRAEQMRELQLLPAHGDRSFIRAVLKKRFSLWTILSLIPVHYHR